MSFPVTLYHNLSVMTQHVPPRGEAVEEPARIVGIEAKLKGHPIAAALQIWMNTGSTEIPVKPDSIWASCKTVEIADAITNAVVATEYGEKAVRSAEYNTPARGSKVDPSCGDIYWSAGTWLAAKTAAAAAIQATEAALREGGHAFAIVRPPGHHCFDVPEGFCILNNVVLAAKKVLAAGKRVAILDWDYHFGDGTAAALWGEDAAMFVSIHAAMTTSGRPTYPANTRRDFKGAGLRKATQGRSFNVQWTHDDADDAALAYAFQHLILPAMDKFAPDVILVSAGYDAIKGDDLAGMNISPAAFRYLSAALTQLGKPVVCVLEGGYNVHLLAEGVAETIQGLQEPPLDLQDWLAQEPQAQHKTIVDEERSWVFGSEKNLD